MYTKMIPYKNFKGEPRNKKVEFNLTAPDVFKLLGELQQLYSWFESMEGNPRELSTEEVQEFYTNFEDILLAAWGVMSEDGESFERTGVYQWKETALFAATMVYFVTHPEETGELVLKITPDDLQDIVKASEEAQERIKNDANTPDDIKAKIAQLQAQQDALKGNISE